MLFFSSPQNNWIFRVSVGAILFHPGPAKALRSMALLQEDWRNISKVLRGWSNRGRQQNQPKKNIRQKLKSSKFGEKSIPKAKTVISTERIWTAQGEMHCFSLSKRRGSPAFWEPGFWYMDARVLTTGGRGTAAWKCNFIWGGRAASLGKRIEDALREEKMCQIKRVYEKESAQRQEGKGRKKPVQETTKFCEAGDYFALIQATEMFDPLYNRKALKLSVLQGKSTK